MLSPIPTNDFRSLANVSRALHLKSPAPDEAAKEAVIDPSLHVDVEKEGPWGLGTSIQPAAPELSEATNVTAHDPDNSSSNRHHLLQPRRYARPR